MPKPAQKMFKDPLGFVELYALCVIGLDVPYNELIAKNDSAKAKLLVENWQAFSELDLHAVNDKSKDDVYPDGRLPVDKLNYLKDLQVWCKGELVNGNKPEKPDYFSGKYSSEIEEMEAAYARKISEDDEPVEAEPVEEVEEVEEEPEPQQLTLQESAATAPISETKARTIHELKARMSGQSLEPTGNRTKRAVKVATRKRGLSKAPLDIAAKDVEALKSLANTITEQSSAIEATFQSVQKLRSEVYPKTRMDQMVRMDKDSLKKLENLEYKIKTIEKALLYILNNMAFESARDSYFVGLEDVPEVEEYMDVTYEEEEE